jgi:hypothetical protein
LLIASDSDLQLLIETEQDSKLDIHLYNNDIEQEFKNIFTKYQIFPTVALQVALEKCKRCYELLHFDEVLAYFYLVVPPNTEITGLRVPQEKV